jgi:hypothetical protein
VSIWADSVGAPSDSGALAVIVLAGWVVDAATFEPAG